MSSVTGLFFVKTHRGSKVEHYLGQVNTIKKEISPSRLIRRFLVYFRPNKYEISDGAGRIKDEGLLFIDLPVIETYVGMMCIR